MRKFSILLVLAVILSSCATMGTRYVNEVKYSLALVKVERPKETMKRWGEVEKIDLSENEKYHYEDKLIDSYFVALSDRIIFDINNKTDHSIKLIWDEASFIGSDGSASRIMHSGVRYIDRNASQPPSVIPGNGSMNDVILPTNRVWYREGYYGTYYSKSGGWEHLGLIQPQFEIAEQDPTQNTTITPSDTLRKQAANEIGKKIGVLLPLEIQGTVNEYTFWFEVTDYSLEDPVPLSLSPLFN